jgi:adenosylcobyric acid synthase
LDPLPTSIGNYQEQREGMLDSLADFVETHVNLEPILQSLPEENETP